MIVNSNSFKEFLLSYVERNKTDLLDSYHSETFDGFSSIQSYVVEKMNFSLDGRDIEVSFHENNGFNFRVKKAKTPTPEEVNSYSMDYPLVLERFVEAYKFPDEDFFLIQSDFPVYENFRIDKAEYEKLRGARRLSLYNYFDWERFIKELILHFFKDYQLSELFSSKSIQRILKKVGEFYLGIEYSSKELQAEIKRGRLCFPEVRLVVLDQNSKAKSTESSSGYMLLSKLPHPLMKALFPVESYVASKQVKKTGDGQAEILNPIREKVQGDKIHLFGDEDFGEPFKKYMAAYVHYFSIFELEYLNLFENALIEFQNPVNEG